MKVNNVSALEASYHGEAILRCVQVFWQLYICSCVSYKVSDPFDHIDTVSTVISSYILFLEQFPQTRESHEQLMELRMLRDTLYSMHLGG